MPQAVLEAAPQHADVIAKRAAVHPLVFGGARAFAYGRLEFSQRTGSSVWMTEAAHQSRIPCSRVAARIGGIAAAPRSPDGRLGTLLPAALLRGGYPRPERFAGYEANARRTLRVHQRLAARDDQGFSMGTGIFLTGSEELINAAARSSRRAR